MLANNRPSSQADALAGLFIQNLQELPLTSHRTTPRPLFFLSSLPLCLSCSRKFTVCSIHPISGIYCVSSYAFSSSPPGKIERFLFGRMELFWASPVCYYLRRYPPSSPLEPTTLHIRHQPPACTKTSAESSLFSQREPSLLC